MSIYSLSNELYKIQKNINEREKNFLNKPRSKAIIDFIKSGQFFTNKELSFRLNIPYISVCYHINKMHRLGIVKRVQYPTASVYVYEAAPDYKEMKDVDDDKVKILDCIAKHGFARWTNLGAAADQLGVELNSFLYAIKLLQKKNFITIEPDEYYLEVRLSAVFKKLEDIAKERKKFSNFQVILYAIGLSQYHESYVREYMNMRSIRIFYAKSKIYIERYIPEGEKK